jgi:nuclear pore complex protein Nup160
MRILNIYDSTGFGEAISTNVFERLEADLAPFGGIAGLNNELFLSVLELLAYKSKKSKSSLRTTIFGNLLLEAGTTDTLLTQQQLLTDLLTLAIFVEGELSQEDDQKSFDASEIYYQIALILTLCNRNLWLALHRRRVPLAISGAQDQHSISILEDALSKAVRPQPAVEKPLMYLITDQLAEIEEWASGKDTLDPEDGAVYLMCEMLKHEEYDLAAEFLVYMPATAWSSYVKGRLAVAQGDFDTAAFYLKKATYGLAHGKAVGNLVALSAGLLSSLDAESFNNGLPAYLHHVATLFDSAKAYDQVAHFARLALKHELGGNPLRKELLLRLFNAELEMARFRRALDTLVQLSDPALQRSSVSAQGADVCSRGRRHAIASAKCSDVAAFVCSVADEFLGHPARQRSAGGFRRQCRRSCANLTEPSVAYASYHRTPL